MARRDRPPEIQPGLFPIGVWSAMVDALVMRTITRILISIPIIALPFSTLLGISDTLVLEE